MARNGDPCRSSGRSIYARIAGKAKQISSVDEPFGPPVEPNGKYRPASDEGWRHEQRSKDVGEMRERDAKHRADVQCFPALAPGGAEPGAGGFQKRLAAAIAKDFSSAVRLVRDHFPRYLAELPGDLLFRIGVALYQDGDLERARHCLELASTMDGSWQSKAMLLISGTYEETGNARQAASVIEDLLDRQPEKMLRRQAMKRLMKLRSLIRVNANEP